MNQQQRQERKKWSKPTVTAVASVSQTRSAFLDGAVENADYTPVS